MPIQDSQSIKQIVCTNFDNSYVHYETFEQKYGLFEFLTRELTKVCDIQPGMSVLDVGCGTGSSSFVMADFVGEKGKVIGIDFSEKMLKIAIDKLEDYSKNNIEFNLCDADNIANIFNNFC